MRKPKASVVIPTYNRQQLLKKAVASVLGQTFTDYELIISDNCSDDNTQKWAQRLSRKDRRVKYFRNQKNLGMVGNWNQGLARTQGKYVSLLMDDDCWEPDFLKKTVAVLDQRENVGLTAVWITPVYLSKNVVSRLPRGYYRLYQGNQEVKGAGCIGQYLDDQWLVGLPSGVLVRKKCFDQLGWFDEIVLDQEMWLRICSRWDFYYLDQDLCHYGVHQGESFSAKNANPFYRLYSRFYLRSRIVYQVLSYSYQPSDLFKIFGKRLPAIFIKEKQGKAKIISLYQPILFVWLFLVDAFSLVKMKMVKSLYEKN